MAEPERTLSWRFLALVLLLSLPFYAVGAAGDRLPLASFLPVSALMTFVPMTAALILVARDEGTRTAGAFLTRCLDVSALRRPAGLVRAAGVMAALLAAQIAALSLFRGSPPDLAVLPAWQVLAFTAMFLVGAIGEEVGWQGYLFPAMHRRMGALRAAVIMGLAWAVWHLVPYVEMGRAPGWIVWHGLATLCIRILLVWLYLAGGRSVLVAIVAHAMVNIPWGLFQNYDALYDPRFAFATYASAVLAIAVAGRTLYALAPDAGRDMRYDSSR